MGPCEDLFIQSVFPECILSSPSGAERPLLQSRLRDNSCVKGFVKIQMVERKSLGQSGLTARPPSESPTSVLILQGTSSVGSCVNARVLTISISGVIFEMSTSVSWRGHRGIWVVWLFLGKGYCYAGSVPASWLVSAAPSSHCDNAFIFNVTVSPGGETMVMCCSFGKHSDFRFSQ